MIYKSIPEIEQVFLGSTAIGKILNGSSLVFVHNSVLDEYIQFADPNVKSIIVNAYGSNGEITYRQAAAVTEFFSGEYSSTNPFFRNKNITSFDEFQYFTNVRSIGKNTFRESSLTSIVFPNSVTSVGDVSFYRCADLESVTFGNSVTSIGDHAFFECTSLVNVNNLNSVRTIGYRAFSGCSNMVGTLTLPSITTIGNESFRTCSSLSGVVFGNSLTTIGEYTFADCSGMKGTLTLPNSVTSIGWYAFLNCRFDGTLTIPNGITALIGAAFEGNAFSTVIVPSSVTSINTGFAAGTLRSVTFLSTVPPSAENLGFHSGGYSFPIYVPAGSLNAYKTADKWSSYESRLTAIINPSDNIVFADSNVKSIIVGRFGSNGEITYGQAAAVTGEFPALFTDNTDITSFDEFKYFTGVTSIASKAFYGCTSLVTIDMPISVTNIKSQAFRGCTALNGTLLYDTWMSPSGTQGHGMALPPLTTIGQQAFHGCTHLLLRYFPHTLTTLGNYAFYNCKAITIHEFPDSLTSISTNAFYGCVSIGTIKIHDYMTSIGSSAFQSATYLKNLTIGSSVTSILSYAFYRCSRIESVTIPASVTEIGNGAFQSCTGLTSITCNATTPPTLPSSSGYYYTFSDTNDCPIYVPSASVAAYKAATGWSEYASRIQALS